MFKPCETFYTKWRAEHRLRSDAACRPTQAFTRRCSAARVMPAVGGFTEDVQAASANRPSRWSC
jgi:hypothetical protein